MSVTEGDTGTVAATFTVTLSAVSGRAGHGRLRDGQRHGRRAGDYTAASGTLTFAAGADHEDRHGARQRRHARRARRDVLRRPLERDQRDDRRRAGRRHDHRRRRAADVSINDVTVTEGNSGTVNANFTVSLSAASGQTVSVDYATADGTATAPGDYTAAGGNLVFAPGQVTKTVDGPGQRRHTRRARRDLHGQPRRRGQCGDRRRHRGRDDHATTTRRPRSRSATRRSPRATRAPSTRTSRSA